MSEEFRTHHNVDQILFQLRISGGTPAEQHTEKLLENRTPFVTTQVNSRSATVRLAEQALKPKDFLDKHDELKTKNVRHLDPMVYLLSNISENASIKNMLASNAEYRGEVKNMIPLPKGSRSIATELPASGTKITPQELAELRSTLQKTTGSSSGTTLYPTSEAIRKVLREQHASRHAPLQSMPFAPDWLAGDNRRHHLTQDFVYNTATQLSSNKIGSQSKDVQERWMIRDLLSIFQGHESRYILARQPEDKHSRRRFVLDPSLDISLRDVALRLLSLASSYSIVVKFMEEKSLFEYGQVNQALCAAIRLILEEYKMGLVKLESVYLQNMLGIHKLEHLLQPTLERIDTLARITVSLDKGKCFGGEVLTLLHEKTLSSIGDQRTVSLCSLLIKEASFPYLEMLEKWIHRGQIEDCYGEFMVEEREKFNKEKLQDEYEDRYWDSRYTLCPERIPRFLETTADKILNTGKYLNVVRECGRDVMCPSAREIVYEMDNRFYAKQIEQAHAFASKLLLDLLLEEHNLTLRLRSLKRFFLLNEGDFLLQFMDLTEDEMRMPMKKITPSRLEALLELALRTSIANHDPYKDDLRVVLLNCDLITQLVRICSIDTSEEEEVIKSMRPSELNLSGLESFAFDYVVKWPLSLVISRKALTKYQMLSRHLFYCKHVERQLSAVWISLKSTKKENTAEKPWVANALTIRQRMFHFIYSFEYYMMYEVIEPNWHIMEERLKEATNVDDVLALHTDFLEQCLNDCLLTNTQLLRILSKLLMLCVSFCNFMQSINRQVDSVLRKETLERSTLSGPPTSDEVLMETQKVASATKEAALHFDTLASTSTYTDIINTFEKNFTEKLLEMLEKISIMSREEGHHNIYNIIHKLDYNMYYLPRTRMPTRMRL